MCALWITGASAQEIEDRMGAALSAFAGQPIGIESVRPSPAPGIVEVQVINGPLLYATEDGGYFFLNGDLHQVSVSGAVNLTEERRSLARKEQLAAVSLEDMVVFSPKGETRDYVSVFTDVTCFYCQKLHREVDQLNAKGVEVRYLAFPRGGINSDGAKKLATAWCADDQQTTLTELKAGMDLPVNDCADSPIAAQYQLGQEMGVSGTPAIITSSGMMIPGYRPAADLIVALGLD
jgi:thiol:disulfide interchange protein DsbC|tara:strand:- start:1703 stop:2407 length:705 start_codon:yes stop_codon:yes gene_type:complete